MACPPMRFTNSGASGKPACKRKTLEKRTLSNEMRLGALNYVLTTLLIII